MSETSEIPRGIFDAFALLGLVPQFDLDPETLRRAYFAQQRLAHPDMQNGSVGASTQLNRAYETLGSPVLRGAHLLELSGISAPLDYPLDVQTLSDHLEWSEKWESTETAQQRQTLQDEIRHQWNHCLDQFGRAWPHDLNQAQIWLVRARYHETLLRRSV